MLFVVCCVVLCVVLCVLRCLSFVGCGVTGSGFNSLLVGCCSMAVVCGLVFVVS